MVYALLPRNGSTILRSHLRTHVTPTVLPHTFTRHASITQAIEAGKRRGNPAKGNTRRTGSPGSTRRPGQSRFEARREKFGTPPHMDPQLQRDKRIDKRRDKRMFFEQYSEEQGEKVILTKAVERPGEAGTSEGQTGGLYMGGIIKRGKWNSRVMGKGAGRSGPWEKVGSEATASDNGETVRGGAPWVAGDPRQRWEGRGARSSRFGRVDSPGNKDGDMPSRRPEEDDEPARPRGGVGTRSWFARGDQLDKHGALKAKEIKYGEGGDQGKSAKKSYVKWDDRGGDSRGERKSFGARRAEGGKEGSARRKFASTNGNGEEGRTERRPYAGRNTDGGERRPYAGRSTEGGERGERQPYRRSDSTGFERDQGRRPYDSRGTGYTDRGAGPRPYGRSNAEGGDRGSHRRTPEASPSFSSGPEMLPYTTAASEFIYGHSSVLAAMKANRRKLYKLYVHSERGGRDNFMSKVRERKLFEITSEVGDEYLRAMDKASSGRPHNGVVLEASPLPVPPIIALKTPSTEDERFGVVLDTQSAEDALVNGKNEIYSYKSGGWRQPLILFVDGVLDEGNLGAMARSAYFLGVDAIITSTHHIAPWSHIALKASAGAAEAIPIFKVGKPADFLTKSRAAGWKIYASDAVPVALPSIQTAAPETPEAETPEVESSRIVYTLPKSSKRLDADYSPLTEAPTILMMGAEATGLKYGLANLAHYNVGIPHGRDVNEVGVDSLNVSAAAALLCYEMLQRPRAKMQKKSEDSLF